MVYDFVMERTQDGRRLKLLTVDDEYTRECLAIVVRRWLTSWDVQEVLSELFLLRGCPTHIQSDHGPEFIARALRAWYRVLTLAPLFIEPRSSLSLSPPLHPQGFQEGIGKGTHPRGICLLQTEELLTVGCGGKGGGASAQVPKGQPL